MARLKDPSEIYTKQGTPIIVLGSRILFAIYFIFVIITLEQPIFSESTVNYPWLLYLLAIYYGLERCYIFFHHKKIDISYAYPLVLAVYIFSIISMLLNAQDQYPIINRAEHLLAFVLLTYVIWTFFLKYLPQKVWREHPYYTALLVFSVTSTLGVFNELIELILDALFNTRFIGPYLDTPLDLLMNSLGITLFLAVRLILGPDPSASFNK